MAVTDADVGTLRTNPFRPAPPTQKEHDDVEMLMSMMGPDCHYDTALRVLRQNGGSLEKAAGALLEENAAADAVIPRTPPPSKPERGSPPVIDLTGDGGEELSRALAASLEDQGPTFGPSDRAPHPDWAVVPSNVKVNTGAGDLSQEEQHLNRAIEASLNYEMMDTYDELPVEERVRKGDCPVSLRPTRSAYVYAGLILHGLFFVPQVRQAIARYRPIPENVDENMTDIDIPVPRSGPAHVLWSLLEAFVNMDLARTTELNIDEALEAFDASPWSSPAEQPGEVAFNFYSGLAWSVEGVLHGNESADYPLHSLPRLFHFRYGFSDSEPNFGPFDKRYDMSIVRVSIPGTPDANDLLSCLSSELSIGSPELGKQQVIFEPSDVVAFQLHRTHVSNGGKSERTTFKYPKSVYLDQFLRENVEISGEKRKLQRELFAEIEYLKMRRTALTKHDDRDVLPDLRSALHYYENIAEDMDNAERKATNHDAALKLRKISTRIENELQTIDTTIAKHQFQAASVYDCPELQKHRYDLRVVLVHDGLYGRNRLYSYVKQRDMWWKTVDYTVTQVSEETVFNDPVGLHLNAGPFFLIYSRAISPEEENARAPWPADAKDSVKYNNIKFLGALTTDIRAKAIDPNSPPSTPVIPVSHVPSEMSSNIVEPPSPRDDVMDITDG